MFINRDEHANLYESTTETLSNSIHDTDFDTMILKVVNIIYLFYTPIVVILGTIGNMVSLFVFYSSKLRLQSTSQYLSTLAVADNLFLVQLIPPWLNATGITTVFHRTGFCQIFVYLSYVSCCLSAWLVVAFTVERFVAVVYPLRRNTTCSVNRARQVILALIIIAIILNLPVLRFATPTKNDCNINRKYLDHAARFNLIDTFLSFTLPLGIIIVMNIWIMIGVCRLERTRRALMKENHPMTGRRLRRRRLASYHQSQHKVTRMLVLVSSVFVVLNLPAYTIRIVAYAYDINANEVSGRWTALQQLAVMFFNTNFGINFLLYCLSGQNYRRALYQALPWVRRRASRAVAVRFAGEPQVRTNSVSTSTNVNTEATVVTVEPEPLHTRNARTIPNIGSTRNFSKIGNTRITRNTGNTSNTNNTGDTGNIGNISSGQDSCITRWTFSSSRQGRNKAPNPVPVHGNCDQVEMTLIGAIGRFTVIPPTLSRPLVE